MQRMNSMLTFVTVAILHKCNHSVQIRISCMYMILAPYLYYFSIRGRIIDKMAVVLVILTVN